MSRIRLIAASDDYLLEERLAEHVAEVRAGLGDPEPELQGELATPESVATELVSPSLFATERLLVVPDAREWLDAPVPPGLQQPRTASPDPEPLIRVISEGLPEEVALVLGAWCGRKPKGPLVEAVESAGVFEWIPLPSPPKPWETAVLSDEQVRVLSAVLRRAADGKAFSRDAETMLLERLGFAPRLLVQEVRKLTGAAGDGEVDSELVRRLTFPRERSLEVVRDAVLGRRLEPLLDLVAAASSGAPINDWQGRRVEPGGFGAILVGQVTSLLQQMLYLRMLATANGIDGEMAPERTSQQGWYAKRFKGGLAPKLIDAIKGDAPSPLLRPKGKPPTPFSLGAVFAGCGRYTDAELGRAIIAAAEVEVGTRKEGLVVETLTAWLAGVVGGGSR